ncbi:MAG: DUF2064 domain-containing protein [Nitrospiraceae bacterium]|nr:DUF2064 domain-containing protein [Nitrospiraceae bacterium]
MREGARIDVVIPALNEEASIEKVLDAIPEWVDDIVVGDNGSTDRTREVAERHGARVVLEPRRGYGAACLAAMGVLDKPDVVVFLDGDFSDYPEEMDALVDPIIGGEAALVIGSRVRGEREPGALTPQARFGNWLACGLMRLFWGQRFTDLGPFRAIAYPALMALGMRDRDYGWTVEMQIKAVCRGVRAMEVPVRYRKRIGRSKVSGTVRGIVGAGTKILSTIALSALWPPVARERLVLFTRYPRAGHTKTRLIPALGPDGAADLHRGMAERTARVAREFGQSSFADVEVRFCGAGRRLMRGWLGSGFRYRRQGRGDLGLRMCRAIGAAFGGGTARVVVIGADCPELTGDTLARAFAALEANDLVLGPAVDGGYYLIGLRRGAQAALASLFDAMPWGSAEVFPETLMRAEGAGLSVATLDTLHDVDRPEDLEVWERTGGG